MNLMGFFKLYFLNYKGTSQKELLNTFINRNFVCGFCLTLLLHLSRTGEQSCSKKWVGWHRWFDLTKNTLTSSSLSQTRDMEMETSITQLQLNKGRVDIALPSCISDLFAMLKPKHKRCHYTPKQVHYCWYKVAWLGHVDVLRVSSFKQCVGFEARPQHRLLFEKINRSQAVYICENDQICCKGMQQKAGTQDCYFTLQIGGN